MVTKAVRSRVHPPGFGGALRGGVFGCLALLSGVVGCSSQTPDNGDEPKTPKAISEAQGQLFGALFEDPPDFARAAGRMSLSCREASTDSEEVVSVVYADVELAQQAGLDASSVLEIFTQIGFEIEGDTASGDDGSEWRYEEGRWRLADC